MNKGSRELNLLIDYEVFSQCADHSCNSIAVFQELIKEVCFSSNVQQQTLATQRITDVALVKQAVRKLAESYAVRHQRALEAIASDHQSDRKNKKKHYLPYYLVTVILREGASVFEKGFGREQIDKHIMQLHHSASQLKKAHITLFLNGLSRLQQRCKVTPPIFDYDEHTRRLQIIDSLFYFFLRNANLKQILDDLPNPMDV